MYVSELSEAITNIAAPCTYNSNNRTNREPSKTLMKV